LESILGTKLQFEPRRRGDIESSSPLRKQTSNAVAPPTAIPLRRRRTDLRNFRRVRTRSAHNQDLEGLIFPDMPWMLGSDLAEQYETLCKPPTQRWRPSSKPLFRVRLDAYRLATALHSGATNIQVDGLTGRLTLDPTIAFIAS